MKSLFARLMAAFSVLILLVVVAVGGSTAYLIHGYLLSSKTADLLIHGRELAGSVGANVQGRVSPNATQSILETVRPFITADVWLVDRQGTMMAGPNRNLPRGVSLGPAQLTALHAGHEVVERVKGIASGQGPALFVLVPVRGPATGDVVGGVLLYEPLTELLVTVGQLRLFLLYSAGGAALLSILVALFLSRALASPLHAMTRTALAMARGEFGQRLQVRSHDEISQLARAFNHLSEELEGTLRALAAEKARMAEMIASMGEGVIATDARGAVISLNPAATSLMGTQDAQALGRPLAEAVQEPDLIALFLACLRSGTLQSGVVPIRGQRLLRVLVTPISSEGMPTGAVGLLEDVSEAQRLEQRQRDFVANVAHELRTPLTAVRGYLEPLIDGTLARESDRERYLQVVHRETLRLAALVNDLLDLAQLEGNTGAFETEPTDLADLLSRALERFHPVASSRSVSLRLDVPNDLPLVAANPDRIDQVVVNLLANAVRFSPASASVVVSARQAPAGVQVVVSDSGPGVAPEDLPFIWDRFYKGDKARTGHNAGLGLAIVKQIIERHGGHVFVQSNPTGGASFGFLLPPASESR